MAVDIKNEGPVSLKERERLVRAVPPGVAETWHNVQSLYPKELGKVKIRLESPKDEFGDNLAMYQPPGPLKNGFYQASGIVIVSGQFEDKIRERLDHPTDYGVVRTASLLSLSVGKLTPNLLGEFVILHEIGHGVKTYGMDPETLRKYLRSSQGLLPDKAAYRESQPEVEADEFAAKFMRDHNLLPEVSEQ